MLAGLVIFLAGRNRAATESAEVADDGLPARETFDYPASAGDYPASAGDTRPLDFPAATGESETEAGESVEAEVGGPGEAQAAEPGEADEAEDLRRPDRPAGV